MSIIVLITIKREQKCSRFLFVSHFSAVNDRFKACCLMEQILLYTQSVVCGETLAGDVHICICKSLIGNMLAVRAIHAVFIGICKRLHDEHSVGHINSTVAVGVAVNRLFLCFGRGCGSCR